MKYVVVVLLLTIPFMHAMRPDLSSKFTVVTGKHQGFDQRELTAPQAEVAITCILMSFFECYGDRYSREQREEWKEYLTKNLSVSPCPFKVCIAAATGKKYLYFEGATKKVYLHKMRWNGNYPIKGKVKYIVKQSGVIKLMDSAENQSAGTRAVERPQTLAAPPFASSEPKK